MTAEILALREALDATIPPKRDGVPNLLIATWNLKAFSSLSDVWTAGADDSPKRDWRALWAITEIVSRFDVIAIQEVKGDLKALRTMLKTLGRDWQLLMTDVTRGTAGNNERLAFLFDSRRVGLSGLACELVVPEEELNDISPDALTTQFARTPYAVGFRAGDITFVLVTLHVLYGDDVLGRVPELRAIAKWMADWAEQTTEWEQNLIVLGDFNIERHDSPLWRAFSDTGLTVPRDLDEVMRSIFAKDGAKKDHYYDQIAWFEEGNKRLLNLNHTKAGSIDFVPLLYRDIDLPKAQMQHRVSDHYPLWVEFVPDH
ncbi:endonuclease/exonuclease/phosphatase family protein [Methyloligella sp. 2.7D]|uniref:endonuclease/exonuclease/phosphatase family protein n=1 Tax=unclassified Methyloligella TaxID=2625955 RepID=UPI001ABA77E7|nr:endonuclease/exonuclease/phosphatase family protein [Methyloligella sp. GL2]